MKKLSLNMLKNKLSNNFMLNDFEHIIVKPHINDTMKDYTIVYKMCLINLTCSINGILGSCEGFITLTRMEYLTDFVKALEELLK